MILKALLPLLLPLLCDCKIQINITVASNKRDAEIKFAGADYKVITEHEIDLFTLRTLYLNWGFRLELGRQPNGFYFKDPTPYGNLFHKFKWSEAKRKTQVTKVEIHELMTSEIVLRTHEHVNNSTEDIETDVSLFTEVENSVHSIWSKMGLPGEDIFTNITIQFDNSSMKYENKWRDRSLKTAVTKFGYSENLTMTLKSGKGVLKKLSALKTIFVVHVEYKTHLIGNIIADYENLYGKYHFYAPTIENIMRASEIPNDIRTHEKIEIRCYTNPKLEIFDRDTNAPINFHKHRELFWKPSAETFLQPNTPAKNSSDFTVFSKNDSNVEVSARNCTNFQVSARNGSIVEVSAKNCSNYSVSARNCSNINGRNCTNNTGVRVVTKYKNKDHRYFLD